MALLHATLRWACQHVSTTTSRKWLCCSPCLQVTAWWPRRSSSTSGQKGHTVLPEVITPNHYLTAVWNSWTPGSNLSYGRDHIQPSSCIKGWNRQESALLAAGGWPKQRFETVFTNLAAEFSLRSGRSQGRLSDVRRPWSYRLWQPAEDPLDPGLIRKVRQWRRQQHFKWERKKA